ncbi:methyltransferase, FxLD system [Streptomyces cinnamoneus]|uniref:methyltransferase, FxLD system n=1 Tax=Streptomyces cinnamoneus TaxID=53446 RepID=UPI003408EDBC
MHADTVSDEDQVDALREAMIAELRTLDAIRSDRVEAAFRVVPRHLFAPDDPLAEVYATQTAVITKRDQDGRPVSAMSASRIQAFMLEQADIRPGMRVLEIGSGGCNAALIAELVGEEGEVTTVDIDSDITDRARRCLTAAGYKRVQVLLVDGEMGVPERAPFDRIVVTVEAPDIPPAWLGQLADGGRIVLPFRTRALTRSIAFEREAGHLVSRSYELCGFVPMQGAGRSPERLISLHECGVGFRLDDDTVVDADRLSEALAGESRELWTGVTIDNYESWDQLDLWLATVLPGFGMLTFPLEARESGVVATGTWPNTSALIDGPNFAYRALRPLNPDRIRYEFGALGYGPDAGKVAEHLAQEIRTWDRDHRSNRARFEVHPAGTPDAALPSGRVIDKRHTRVAISWPHPGR